MWAADGAAHRLAGALAALRRPQRMFALLSTVPAGIARLRGVDPRPAGHSAHGGPLEAGAAANLCVFDPSATTSSIRHRLASRSRNTPYAGRSFTGAVRHTMLRGEPVVDRRRGAAMSRRDRQRRYARTAGTPGDGRRRGVRGRGGGRGPPDRHRGTGLQHRHERLSGGDLRPLVRRPGGGVHQHPHRQLRHQRRRRRGRRPYCRGVVVRDLTVVPSNWRATEGLESFFVRHGLPGSPASTPGA